MHIQYMQIYTVWYKCWDVWQHAAHCMQFFTLFTHNGCHLGYTTGVEDLLIYFHPVGGGNLVDLTATLHEISIRKSVHKFCTLFFCRCFSMLICKKYILLLFIEFIFKGRNKSFFSYQEEKYAKSINEQNIFFKLKNVCKIFWFS